MKREFRRLQKYLKNYDGYGKPRINFQKLYDEFQTLTFVASDNFGEYKNFGKAFEYKCLDMLVIAEDGAQLFMVYREYSDKMENLTYVSEI